MAEVELTDTELVDRFAHAVVDHDNKDFYRGLLAHELRVNHCGSCGRYHQPPRPMCPWCWSWDVTPTAVSGHGTVHLLMKLHQGPPAPGVDYSKGPHPVVTVELVEQESVRYTSTLINCSLEDMHIGLPVQLTWIERRGVPFPVFEPAKG